MSLQGFYACLGCGCVRNVHERDEWQGVKYVNMATFDAYCPVCCRDFSAMDKLPEGVELESEALK